MNLTADQVKNWKNALIIMGLMPMVVNSLSDLEIETIAKNFQARIDHEERMRKFQENLTNILMRNHRPKKKEFKSKFPYKRF